MLYFAYGSNLLVERLAARCPSARISSLASALSWSIGFSKPSADGSGKATIFKREGSTLPGILFDIEDSDLPALDAAEERGVGYDAIEDFAVVDAAGATRRALTYVAIAPDPALKPYDWYLALVLAGATRAGFDAGYRRQLRGQAFHRDPAADRPGRRTALSALRAAGYGGPDDLLAR